LARAAQLGQAAWFFGNLYEGLVGMPQLLAETGAARDRGLLAVGSPVRYFAPVAPLAVAANALALVDRWRSSEDADRHRIAVAGASTAASVGISAYLIRVVNIPLLTDADALTPARRRQLISTWHALNAVRLVCLAIAHDLVREALPSPDRRGAHIGSARWSPSSVAASSSGSDLPA
jgi:hypothetical protein